MEGNLCWKPSHSLTPGPGVGGGIPRTSAAEGGLTCRQTRDFSRRNCSMRAPLITPLELKWMSIYFPKRLELSFRIVLAFPKAEGQRVMPMMEAERREFTLSGIIWEGF